MGTFTGIEVASRKSVTMFLLMMFEWTGNDSLLVDDTLENDDDDECFVNLKENKKSHMFVCLQSVLD